MSCYYESSLLITVALWSSCRLLMKHCKVKIKGLFLKWMNFELRYVLFSCLLVNLGKLNLVYILTVAKGSHTMFVQTTPIPIQR